MTTIKTPSNKKRVRKSYAFRNRHHSMEYIRDELGGCVEWIRQGMHGKPNGKNVYVKFIDGSLLEFPDPKALTNALKVWVGYAPDDGESFGIIILKNEDGKFVFHDSPHLSEELKDQFMKCGHYWAEEIRYAGKTCVMEDGTWAVRDQQGQVRVVLGHTKTVRKVEPIRPPIIELVIPKGYPLGNNLAGAICRERNSRIEHDNKMQAQIAELTRQRDNMADMLRVERATVAELRKRAGVRKGEMERQGADLKLVRSQLAAVTEIANMRAAHMMGLTDVVKGMVNAYGGLRDQVDAILADRDLAAILRRIYPCNSTASFWQELFVARNKAENTSHEANQEFNNLRAKADEDGDTTYKEHLAEQAKSESPLQVNIRMKLPWEV